MITFWREEPLTGKEFALLDAVTLAHRRSALRGNASTVALKNAAGGSGSLEMALASAILTLGGKHAPVRRIADFLNQPFMHLMEQAGAMLERREKIEGWGNSFFKGKPDPDWAPVHAALTAFPEMEKKVAGVTALFYESGKSVYPNAGAFTAATAIILGLPPELSSYLLISARLPVWVDLAGKAM